MKSISLRRLFWVAPLSIISSVLAVLAVQAIALRVLPPLPRFSQAVLHSAEPAAVTAILVSGAVLVFALCVRLATDPLRTYRRIALCVLLMSFVPNVAAAVFLRPSADWPSMIALMTMHVVAWAVSVSMLTGLTLTEDSSDD